MTRTGSGLRRDSTLYVGAEVGQVAPARGAGDGDAQLEDADAGQGPVVGPSVTGDGQLGAS